MQQGKKFVPTKAQRNCVKLLKADGWSDERIAAQFRISRTTLLKAFPDELEFGADEKRMEAIQTMERIAKSGNATAGKWLHERFETAKRAQPVAADQPPAPDSERLLGKKGQRQAAAEQVAGKFAPPAPPKMH